jgi:DNA repair protein RadC
MNIKLKKTERIKIEEPGQIYGIMQRIFMRESKQSRNREHFWTVSLDTAGRILNIELVSLGTVNQTMVTPMEVLSIPLQKKAIKIILVHNHPAGQLIPSEEDKDVTDRLIQACKLMKIEVVDHLIISETDYYSFTQSGLLEELQKSLKYALNFDKPNLHHEQSTERGKKQGMKEKALEMARMMKTNGESIERIMQYTGLSKATIVKLK